MTLIRTDLPGAMQAKKAERAAREAAAAFAPSTASLASPAPAHTLSRGHVVLESGVRPKGWRGAGPSWKASFPLTNPSFETCAKPGENLVDLS